MAKATIVFKDVPSGTALLRIGPMERWYGKDHLPLRAAEPPRAVIERYKACKTTDRVEPEHRRSR
jgi:hypothetical protein